MSEKAPLPSKVSSYESSDACLGVASSQRFFHIDYTKRASPQYEFSHVCLGVTSNQRLFDIDYTDSASSSCCMSCDFWQKVFPHLLHL
jgi:hypothetical protein